MAADDRIFASEDARIEDVASAICDIDARRREESLYRTLALSFLYEKIGKAMLFAGRKKLVRDGFVYHCEQPKERVYCKCCDALLYQCVNTPNPSGTYVAKDALPSFWLSKVREAEA